MTVRMSELAKQLDARLKGLTTMLEVDRAGVSK